MKSVLPWAAKTPPVGAVVGTTDVQTLSGKKIAGSQIDNYVSFTTVAYPTVTTSTATINFANGQKQFVNVQANTTLSFQFPGIGNYQLIIYMAGTYTVTLGSVTYWIGATSQPALANGLGARSLVSLYWDGLQCYCGVAKINAV